MSAQIIDGIKIASDLKKQLKNEIALYKKQGKRAPCLTILMVGDNPASLSYVRNKSKACSEIGIISDIKHLPQDVDEQTLLSEINALNSNEDVDGFMVQLPLPNHITTSNVLNAITPKKDIDGLSMANMGHLFKGNQQDQYLRPCTPLGIIHLIKTALGDNLKGKHAVVVGQSNIVGKPTSALLLEEDCTVTSCHSETKNLPSHIKQADIVVVAIGCPNFIQGDWFAPHTCVIDVGINITGYNEKTGKTQITGDVDFNIAKNTTQYITPVPGGVGPMTIAMLLSNCLSAYRMSYLEKPA